MATSPDNALGLYLKDRRARLDPKAFGYNGARRRTPGLRREEVAQRAYVSATWYTWLEQGRGGTPSVEVLDRLSKALALNNDEREHLFVLAQRLPPTVEYQAPERISASLQHMLDAMTYQPAVVRSAAWDVLAWNHAATVLLNAYDRMPEGERNILKMLFTGNFPHSHLMHQTGFARSAVAAFRVEATRAGASSRLAQLAAELSRASPEFAAIWNDHDVRSMGEGIKHLEHEQLGRISLGFTSFQLADQPDVGVMVFTPLSEVDAERVRAVIDASRA